MANDGDWVEDVKRWYFAGVAATASASRAGSPTEYDVDVGYEAAHPSLQACHWPEPGALTTDR